MKDKFEISLLESGELIKRGGLMLINNVGRVIAAITLIVTALVLFTDIGFQGFGSESFTSTLAIMLIASYLMYFSMEEAGERLGEETDDYQNASKLCSELTERISGDKIPRLRLFLNEYSEQEASYRRMNLLMRYGFGEEDYKSYKSGTAFEKRAVKIFKRADRIKPTLLTPKTLLSRDGSRYKSELTNPERSKFFYMVMKLIPTTLCMTVTVSVMLTAKDNLCAATVIDGIFKLSSLPIIGFRGYAAGYNYTKRTLPLWIATKSRLLDAFLKRESV